MATSRGLKSNLRALLLGRASGRCSFKGCGKDLTRHQISQNPLNLIEVSHTIGFREVGPWGEVHLSVELAAYISNFMLISRECHKEIDDHEEFYPVDLRRKMNASHEARMLLVGSVRPGHQVDKLLYGQTGGVHAITLTRQHAADAMFPVILSDQGMEINTPQVSWNAYEHHCRKFRKCKSNKNHLIRSF